MSSLRRDVRYLASPFDIAARAEGDDAPAARGRLVEVGGGAYGPPERL